MDAETAATAATLERFHFGDAGHVNAEQFRTLRSLDEQLARNLTHALSAWLRTDVTVTAGTQAHQTFREFLDQSDDCYLLPVRLPEVHASGVLRWSLPLAAQMIDVLLGGSGAQTEQVRELTEIEDEIFRAVLEVVLREWNLVWQQISLRLEPGERSRNAGERQLMTPLEKVYSFQFTVTTGETSGDVRMCVAAPVLSSVMRRIPLLQQASTKLTQTDMESLLRSLQHARVRTGLCFPPVRLSAARLKSLRPGNTLVLPLPSNALAEFRVSEVPVASAVPARVGAWRAANITAVRSGATPLSLVPMQRGEARSGEMQGNG